MKKPQIKKIPKYCISGLQQQNHSEHGSEVPVRFREYKNLICKITFQKMNHTFLLRYIKKKQSRGQGPVLQYQKFENCKKKFRK